MHILCLLAYIHDVTAHLSEMPRAKRTVKECVVTVRYYDPTGLVRCVRFDCTAEKMEDVFRECRTEGYIPLVEDVVVLALLDDREFVDTFVCDRAAFATTSPPPEGMNVRVECRRESQFGETRHGRATD